MEHPEQLIRAPKVRGVMRWLFVISVVPLWIVVGVVAALGAHRVNLRGVSGDVDLPHAVQLPLLVLLLISVTARSAVAPFHRWLPRLIEHGPHGLGLFFLAVPVGMHPIVRLVFPIFPEANPNLPACHS